MLNYCEKLDKHFILKYYTNYFSTHGGAGPLFGCFVFEVEGFFTSLGPNFPVFKNACILL